MLDGFLLVFSNLDFLEAKWRTFLYFVLNNYLRWCEQIGCDAKVAPYMNKELLRVFSNEKIWREQLWKKGLIKTSVMSPKKHPDNVGSEEVSPSQETVTYFLNFFSCMLYNLVLDNLIYLVAGSHLYNLPAVFVSFSCCLSLQTIYFCVLGGTWILILVEYLILVILVNILVVNSDYACITNQHGRLILTFSCMWFVVLE